MFTTVESVKVDTSNVYLVVDNRVSLIPPPEEFDGGFRPTWIKDPVIVGKELATLYVDAIARKDWGDISDTQDLFIGTITITVSSGRNERVLCVNTYSVEFSKTTILMGQNPSVVFGICIKDSNGTPVKSFSNSLLLPVSSSVFIPGMDDAPSTIGIDDVHPHLKMFGKTVATIRDPEVFCNDFIIEIRTVTTPNIKIGDDPVSFEIFCDTTRYMVGTEPIYYVTKLAQ